MSSNGLVVAIKKKDGGYVYYTTAELMLGKRALQDNPLIAREISQLNLEIMDAKR